MSTFRTCLWLIFWFEIAIQLLAIDSSFHFAHYDDFVLQTQRHRRSIKPHINANTYNRAKKRKKKNMRKIASKIMHTILCRSRMSHSQKSKIPPSDLCHCLQSIFASFCRTCDTQLNGSQKCNKIDKSPFDVIKTFSTFPNIFW